LQISKCFVHNNYGRGKNNLSSRDISRVNGVQTILHGFTYYVFHAELSAKERKKGVDGMMIGQCTNVTSMWHYVVI